MSKKKTIYLIPLGGLGNRYRVISTAINSGHKIILISLRTKFFPAHLSEVFELEKLNLKEIRVPGIWHDRFTTVLSRLYGLLPFVPSYGVREFSYSGIYASPHAFNYPWFSLKLINRPTNCCNLKHFNAIHLRGTDNKRAIAGNKMDDFFEYVERSEFPVYLATDSAETKHLFKEKFNDKVITTEIDLTRHGQDSFYQAIEEISVLVKANDFMGSNFSSFSKLVIKLRSF